MKDWKRKLQEEADQRQMQSQEPDKERSYKPKRFPVAQTGRNRKDNKGK